ncbi:hypothetical protein [Amnibacterium endophyticum]|uniref:DUF306 domain-containing protein n=1 Tax=Amnibacterium endophyticum TaxID=2109337 RepID=A0ABW4LEN3_9MICO
MLRRVPPIVLAAVTTAVVAVVVVTVVLLTGGGQGRRLAPCTDALEAGPYGCVVLVSLDGSVDGQDASAPSGGSITYRIERTGGRDHLLWSGDCNGGEADVAVSAARYRLTGAVMRQKACEGAGSVDPWAARLFLGDGSAPAVVRVDDRDDGTVVLTQGGYRARFAQVVAARD